MQQTNRGGGLLSRESFVGVDSTLADGEGSSFQLTKVELPGMTGHRAGWEPLDVGVGNGGEIFERIDETPEARTKDQADWDI